MCTSKNLFTSMIQTLLGLLSCLHIHRILGCKCFFILYILCYFFLHQIEEEQFLKDLSETYTNDEESLYKRDAVFTEISFTLNKSVLQLNSKKSKNEIIPKIPLNVSNWHYFIVSVLFIA